MANGTETLSVSSEDVRAALRGLSGPGIEGDLSTSAAVSEISIRNGQVVFAITVDPKYARELEPLRRAAEAAVAALPGVSRAIVALTAEITETHRISRTHGGTSTDDTAA